MEIGNRVLGIGDWAKSPIPNPQSPSPLNININIIIKKIFYLKNKIILFKLIN